MLTRQRIYSMTILKARKDNRSFEFERGDNDALDVYRSQCIKPKPTLDEVINRAQAAQLGRGLLVAEQERQAY